MNSLLTFFDKIKYTLRVSTILGMVLAFPRISNSQTNRIHYAHKDIFLSGINVAWVNFAADLGPNPIDASQFQTEFQTVHANGGNALRVWLHTNGSNTPVYNASGYVTGPGPNTISNLRELLNLAKQNNVGLILCLWSFDMLRTTELDTARLHANIKMLTDTSYTMSYIRNALIPMIDSVKDDSAIIAWEVCNEPNGMTTGYNYYPADPTVSTKSIEVFTNLIAGAIHRTDPLAYVTTGPGSFQTLTDVSPSPLGKPSAISDVQLEEITDNFNASHRGNLTTEEMREYLQKIEAIPDTNFYRDDRLIAAGGDSSGTLDFYCVHYYGAIGLSPFLNSASYWGLNKPIVVAEFYMQPTNGLGDGSLFPALYGNGYAGALAWSWTDFPNTPNNAANAETDTWSALQYMFAQYRNDVIINPKTGSIYVFSTTPSTIEKTDTSLLKWDVEPGSIVKLNGSSVSVKDSMRVNPLVTTTYTLTANGQVSDTSRITLTVLPTGRIVFFKASPVEIGTGESTSLFWHVVKGSSVTLNGSSVPVSDSIVVYPSAINNVYTLIAQGDERDSASLAIDIEPPDQVDRAYAAPVTVSSNDTVAYSFSDPQYITDGNNFSRWQSAATPTAQWAQLDLGRVDTIHQVVIYWGNKEYAKQFSLQTSADLATWNVLASKINDNGGTNYVETLDNLDGIGRYLIILLQVQAGAGYSIAEIQAYGSVATSVPTNEPTLPVAYSLLQNYPNPFNPSTNIRYDVPNAGFVTLTVYNALGQRVAELVNRFLPAGSYTVAFDGSGLSSGVYFYTMQSGNYFGVKKMILLK